jgi:hypothetical protein
MNQGQDSLYKRIISPLNKVTISPLNKVKCVSHRMLYITLRGYLCDPVLLNVNVLWVPYNSA